jgi:hypothetical protein
MTRQLCLQVGCGVFVGVPLAVAESGEDPLERRLVEAHRGRYSFLFRPLVIHGGGGSLASSKLKDPKEPQLPTKASLPAGDRELAARIRLRVF